MHATAIRQPISNRRRQRGGALIEGVLSLCMIIVGSLVAMVFLTDVGMSLYYKQKIGFATSQTAIFAAALPEGNDDKILEYARTLLSKLGNGPSNCTVKHEIIKQDDKTLSQVTIDDELPLLASQFEFLPVKTHMRDTAIAIRHWDFWKDLNLQGGSSSGSAGSSSFRSSSGGSSGMIWTAPTTGSQSPPATSAQPAPVTSTQATSAAQQRQELVQHEHRAREMREIVQRQQAEHARVRESFEEVSRQLQRMNPDR